jgi:MFS superfamily sulfate permease-like transporter
MYVLPFGLAAFTLLLLGNKLFPGRPVSLVVVIASILVISLTDLAQHGFHLAGDIPQGLPPLGRPSLRFRDVDGVLGLALGCFLMGYIETIAVAKTMAEKHAYPVNPRQELLSLGFANLGASLASGYPVAGGLSQSTVNDKAGARTPLSLVFCSVALLMTLLYLTHLLENLPEVMLAALVIDAVLGLIKVKSLKELWRLSRTEFGIAMISLAGVLTFGILKGVLIAALSSIAILIARSKISNVAVLGQVPGTNKFTDIKRNPGNVEVLGIKILRVESSIFYYNQEHILELLRKNTLFNTPATQQVIVDLSSSPNVDVAGAKMLVNFAAELKSNNIRIEIVEALGIVRDMLRKLNIEEKAGPVSRTTTIQEEVEKFRMQNNH